MMEGVKGQCLICQSPVQKGDGDGAVLEKHLEVVFLLRKVLQVPQSLLTRFLEESTAPDEGVESWIHVSGNCRPLVEECQAIHGKLCELNRQWEECRAKVVTKVKQTSAAGPVDVSSVAKETRRFVIRQVDDPVGGGGGNPFVVGDRKGKELRKKKLAVVIPKVKKVTPTSSTSTSGGAGAQEQESSRKPKEEVISLVEYYRRVKASGKIELLKGVKAKCASSCEFCNGVGVDCRFSWLRLHDFLEKLRRAALPRPYKCPHCPRTYRYPSPRDHHVRLKHLTVQMSSWNSDSEDDFL